MTNCEFVKYRLIIQQYLSYKNAAGLDTSKCAGKDGLATSKLDIDNLDVGKSGTSLVDLSTLSDPGKNEVVKKKIS